MKKFLLSVAMIGATAAMAQVGINTEYPQQLFHADGGADNAVSPTLVQAANDVVITNVGQVGIGTITPLRPLEIVRDNNNQPVNSGILLTEYAGNQGQYGAQINLRNSRGTIDTPAPLQNGDVIASYSFDYRLAGGFTNGNGSKIMSNYYGTGADRRNDLRFFTTDGDGTALSAERMRITPRGFVGIGTGNAVLTHTLEVVGMAGAGTAASFRNASGSNSSVEIGASNDNLYVDFRRLEGGSDVLKTNIAYVVVDDRLVINGNDDGISKVVVNTGNAGGNFGVGQANPQAPLHVFKHATSAALTPVIIESLPSYGSDGAVPAAFPSGGLYRVGSNLRVKP